MEVCQRGVPVGVMNIDEQEADLTLWANGVAEVRDEKERPRSSTS
jgi:hypothetical protein